MKKIDLRSPRYILPLIVLPFLAMLNYVVLDILPPAQAAGAAVQNMEEFNANIPAPNLDRRGLKNKFDLVKEAFKDDEDYTAMQELEEEGEEVFEEESKYTLEERQLIDSINGEIFNGNRGNFMQEIEKRTKETAPAQSTSHQEVIAYQSPKKKASKREETAEEREMRLFREQMMMMDSLMKSPEEIQAEQELERQKKLLQALALKEAEEKAKKVQVHKSNNINGDFFNTVHRDYDNYFIKAILDENLKVVDGSRIRIRVMDDLNIGGQLLEKGTYVYATIKSFSPQRVYATVESILVNDQIIPVELTVYDVDGMEGFFVPASKFTEFTKAFAGDLANGAQFSVEPSGEANSLNDLLFGLGERGIQAGSQATGRAARRNRAKLKYNSSGLTK